MNGSLSGTTFYYQNTVGILIIDTRTAVVSSSLTVYIFAKQYTRQMFTTFAAFYSNQFIIIIIITQKYDKI